jgi:hypothetical protein
MTYPSATTWRMFPVQLPSIVLGHLFVLLLLITGIGRRPHYRQGVICVWWRPWVEKHWPYSTTVGHGMGKASWFTERTWFHERIHVWQYEDLCLLGLAAGLALMPWISWRGSLIVWATSGAPWLLPSYLTGLIRFAGRASAFDALYRYSGHERHAYSETESFY